MAYIELFRHEVVHFLLAILAAVITLIFFLRKRKKQRGKAAILIFCGAFIGEFFLDADHLVDYFITFGTNFRIEFFLRGDMFEKSQQMFVPFHAWEWVVVLSVLIYFIKNFQVRYFLIALTLGLFFHLVYDTYYNGIYMGYSFIYRLVHGFKVL